MADILWRQGILFHKMHKGQLAIDLAYRASTQKLFVLDCARQFGKTTWLVIKSIEYALHHPKARIKIGTAFLTDLEGLILPAFDMVLADCPKELLPSYKSHKHLWSFHNGAEIELVGLDRKPDGLRGNKIHRIFIDEGGYVSNLDYLFKSVIIPATTHVPDARIVIASTQPNSPDHDFTKYCDKALIEGGYVQLTIYENPLLTKEKIDELARDVGGYESTAFRREYLCERVVEETKAIIPEFREALHVKEQIKTDNNQFFHKYESLDSGVRDHTGMLFSYYDFVRAKLVIEDEFDIVGHEVTTRRIAELTKEKELERGYAGKLKLRVADNDNLILIQDLSAEFNLTFMPTNKDELHAMVNKVRLWFLAQRVEIHPRCVKLIACLKAGIWDNKRREFERSDIHGHYDLISSLIYLVRNIDEHTNPIPEWWGLNRSEVFYGGRKPSSAAETLKKAFGVK